MKIYLDVCAIQRPLDTPNQVRIALEAEAILGILALSDAGQVEIVSSEVIIYENEQNPLPVRREHTRAVLIRAKSIVTLTDDLKARSGQFLEFGIKPLDALHLASAEASKAVYFCTCDDHLLNRSRDINSLKVKVISPLDLIREIEK